jgi:pyruvate dehydrogenase E1 component
VEQQILQGMYLYQAGGRRKRRVQLLGSGAILREVIAAAELLEDDFNVSANVWSVTSFNELRREGLDVERWNMLHPDETPRIPLVRQQLSAHRGPVVAATDYIRSYPDQIRPFVPGRYKVLGTDGFGRSDMRAQLRKFFEVNRHYVVLAALTALVEDGEIGPDVVIEAMKKYRIDPDKPNPVKV